MKGDFSRQTFRRKKHYSGVLMQQGRVQLDADFNEQLSIRKYRAEMQGTDVIGPSGTPKNAPGFRVRATVANAITIGAGRYYVDGILCENESKVVFDEQPHLQPNGVVDDLAGAGAQVGMMYLDVWERHITTYDDPAIREVALGGADTADRIQVVWQVKALPLPSVKIGDSVFRELVQGLQQRRDLFAILDNNPTSAERRDALDRLAQIQRVLAAGLGRLGITCDRAFPERGDLTPIGTGLMAAQTITPGPAGGACVLPPTAGYQRLENQLYRVEVHTGGSRSNATFKWSRENGSVVTGDIKFSGAELTVDSTGRDDVLGFQNGDWGEIVDDWREFRGEPGQLVQIKEVDPTRSVIKLESAPTPVNPEFHPKLRRWDQTGLAADIGNGIAMTGGWIDLEGGIQVRFSTGNYRTGEYWLIPARTATGQIEWPRTEAPGGGSTADDLPPDGIHHHFADLALVLTDGNDLFVLDDCRKFIPPLTDIHARDVAFDNATCELPGATTVQDALDLLCERKIAGSCTITVFPGDDIQALVDRLGNGADAQICFQVGDYELESPVIFRNKGNLKVIGSGHGARLVAANSEVVLRFEDCDSVIVRDLYVEAGAAGSSAKREHLGGALAFLECENVRVDGVVAQCAPGIRRAGTCITVGNSTRLVSIGRGRGLVCIHHCNLNVGNAQTGILVVNGARIQIEDNFIQVTPKPESLNIRELLANAAFRSRFRRLMISDVMARSHMADLATEAAIREALAASYDVLLDVSGFNVAFNTSEGLTDTSIWNELLRLNPPVGIHDERAMVAHMYGTVDRVLSGDIDITTIPALIAWLVAAAAEDESVAGQGIVIGGQEADDIRILNNTVNGVLQGIHVGLSHREARRGAPDRAGRVMIANNTIRIVLPPTAIRERHGIFVGNVNSLVVERNFLTLHRTTTTQRLRIEGVRVWGHLGSYIEVERNHITGFNVNQIIKRGGRQT